MLVDEIRILNVDYKIKTAKLLQEHSKWGSIDFVDQQITLDSQATPQRIQITLMHEVIHAIYEQLGFEVENENENAIQALSASLIHVLKANPKLFT